MAIRPHSPEVQAHIELVNGNPRYAREQVAMIGDLLNARERLVQLEQLMVAEQNRRGENTAEEEVDWGHEDCSICDAVRAARSRRE